MSTVSIIFINCQKPNTTKRISRLYSKDIIDIKYEIEYNIGNGQISDVTWSAHVMGRYLANAIVSDKSK